MEDLADILDREGFLSKAYFLFLVGVEVVDFL